MKNRLLFQLFYFLFWVGFFFLGRAMFLLYHTARLEGLSAWDVARVFGYGMRLDMSFAAYLSLIPFLMVLLHAFVKKLPIERAIRYYTYFFILLLSLLITTDLELYNAWGFRLDATPLQYLETPMEMMASAASAPVFWLVLLFAGLSFLAIRFYHRFFRFSLFHLKHKNWFAGFASFWYLALLIIPMRGGLQQIPINQSDVYFSENVFANHAGINVPWNVMYGVLKSEDASGNPYQYLPDSVAEMRVQQLYAAPVAESPALLRQTRPNVLFIILESFTAKYVEALGGMPGVTPELNQLAREGVLFRNIYASGDRSQKGLVAVLSGYPVQPATSIVKFPNKTARLPHLAQTLRQLGYGTSFYYGGELAFANIKSYLLNAGFQRLIGKEDFPPSTYNSKWGAHDHVLLARVLQDLNREKQPFFSAAFTLSSHEPYEIPIAAKFAGTEEEVKFRNSIYYTDQAVGNFIREARQQPWWENTLVVLVADHGHRFPGSYENYDPQKFHIPLIFTGGALALRDTTIQTIGSHTDIIPTLLRQMNVPTEEFKWGRDLLHPAAAEFAFYAYTDGFGWVTPHGVFAQDNISKQIITRDSGITEDDILNGQAYQQLSYEDFLKK